jgi:hypothetical protein
MARQSRRKCSLMLAATLALSIPLGLSAADLNEDLLRQWHRSSSSCLEALKLFGRSNLAAAAARLKKGEFERVRETYDTQVEKDLWSELMETSPVTTLAPPNHPLQCGSSSAAGGDLQKRLCAELRSDPGSIYAAAKIIRDWLSQIGAKTTAPPTGVWPGPIPLTRHANCLLQCKRIAQSPNFSCDILGPAKVSATAVPGTADPLFLDQLDASVLFELLYPRRFNSRALDLYRAAFKCIPCDLFQGILEITP